MIKPFIRKYNGIILVSMLIFAVSMLANMMHFLSHKNEMNREVIHLLEKEVDHTANLISCQMKFYRSFAKQGAQQIKGLKVRSRSQISSVLKAYEYSGEFEEAYYIDMNNYMICSNGQMIRLISKQDYEAIDKISFADGAAVVRASDASGEEEKFSTIAPVKDDDFIRGYFVGICDVDKILALPEEEMGKIKPAFFVVNEEGNIISQKLPEEDGETKFDFSVVWNENEITKLQEELHQQKKGFYVTHSDNNEEYCLFYQPIANTGQWGLIVAVPQETMANELNENNFRNIVVLLIGLFLMLLLVGYIILYANRTGKKMEVIAYRDGQTGAANLEYFIETAEQKIASEKSLPYIVARMDILNFRYVNEAFGHERGNQILQKMVDYAQENFGSKEIFARNSADQFTALMIDVEDIETRMEEYAANINEYARSIDVSFPIIIRMGYYPVGKGKDTINDMIDKANVARKTLNSNSKSFTIKYTEEMQKEIKRREHIESSMYYALSHGEFKVYLQPKFDLIENKIAGAEALVRWIKEDGTMVYPDEFIPVFEQNGFIEKLDFYMLESLCRRMCELIQEGKNVLPVSVNQSRVLLMNPLYVTHVKEIIEKYRIPKGMLELEMTETVFFNEKEKMIEIMNELKQSDILIDMDDFGSGFSSLNMLKDVPFDVIKIDRGFFSESASSESTKWILKKVVEMAEGLGVECICEGVETEEQAEILRNIKCRYAQGYLYAKPMPMEEFIEKYVSE